jgi:predicted glycosyltransferase
MEKSKHVLIAPLDWGLGHATRCIPIIYELRARGVVVSIASSGDALDLLRKEFQDVVFFELPPYGAMYSEKLPFFMNMFRQMPKFLLAIYREHSMLQEIIATNKIQLVISDNRFGCWSNKIPSFLITHQVNILFPAGLEKIGRIINYFNHLQIRKFSQCWVPDQNENRLTGALTQTSDSNVKFIGRLSRFGKIQATLIFDLLVLLSGPEPQRTLLENDIVSQLSDTKLKVKIVRGLPSATDELKMSLPNISVDNYSTTQELNLLIEQSSIVISRSGYSTIMDLIKLNKKAIFIPTPGQTEQEYLAIQLKTQMICFSESQNEFDLVRSLEESKKYKGFSGWQMDNDLLSQILDQTLA